MVTQKLTGTLWNFWISNILRGRLLLAPHVLHMGMLPPLWREICSWMAFLSNVGSNLDKHILCMLGLSLDDSFDEAVADMITDGVTDIKNAVIKAHLEKDEAKKVLTVFC